MRRKTHDEFVREVYELHGDKYTILSGYIGSDKKVDFSHDECGNKFSMLASSFSRGKRCPKCARVIVGNKLRKTRESFEEDLLKIVGKDYKLTGGYNGSSEKTEFMHVACGRKYLVKPNAILGGNRCPKCSVTSKLTRDVFEKEVLDLTNGDYLLVGDVNGSTVNTKIMHLKCGATFEMQPISFKSGNRCRVCSAKDRGIRMRKMPEEFNEEVLALTNGEYLAVEPYKTAVDKIEMLHVTCGNRYKVKPNIFLGGRRCPKCAGNMKRTKEEFMNEVRSVVGSEYIFYGSYINYSTKMNVIHTTCGNNYEVAPTTFVQGKRCAICSAKRAGEKKTKTTKMFEAEVGEVFGDNYQILSKYVGVTKNILIKHLECNHEWISTPDRFIRSFGCPKCNSSKGESKIASILDRFGVAYKIQHIFKDCKHIKPLPFDFYVYNNKAKLIIEYDGEQHFSPTKFNNSHDDDKAIKNYESQVLRDNIKNDFCIENDIPLLRIPYWDIDDIERIVFDKLIEKEIIEEVAI